MVSVPEHPVPNFITWGGVTFILKNGKVDIHSQHGSASVDITDIFEFIDWFNSEFCE